MSDREKLIELLEEAQWNCYHTSCRKCTYAKSEYRCEHEQSADHLISNGVTIVPESGIGNMSDGYHTFNELYHHRAILFATLCAHYPLSAWKARKHHDGTMYDGMFIVGINTSEGQATYHYDVEPYWDMFQVPETEFAPVWDGHTPDEAIRRICSLVGDMECE